MCSLQKSISQVASYLLGWNSAGSMSSRNIPIWCRETEMLYKFVIDTVVQNCKEHFLDEGLSEDVVLDLKATWEHHLEHSKVTYNYPPPRPKPAINRPSLHGGSGDLAEVDLIGSAEHVVAAPSQEEAEKGDEDITSEDDEPNTLDPEALFDTENILVCQYEKIVKAKNKWKLLLKSGIMTVNEKDYVFQKCGGDANW